jgi:hypothetical protein
MPDSVLKTDQSPYNFAVEQIRQGVAPEVIEKSLIQRGMDAQKAATLVGNLKQSVKQSKTNGLKQVGRKNMLYGALWCIGGVVVTALSYQAAANSGGGRYVLAWGAILFGGLQFVRGFIQSWGQ